MNVPRGQVSGPFVLDFAGCESSDDIIVTAVLDLVPASSTDIYLISQVKQIVSYSRFKQAIYYVYVDSSVPVSTLYTLKISMSGLNS